MPATSIRDLTIKGDDLVVGTHGRSFWILDNITPLRLVTTMTSWRSPRLYQPQQAIRVRWNQNTDTPLPPDEPRGQNPPEGAILDYALTSDAESVALEILNAQGAIVRRYSGDDAVPPVKDVGNWPAYWQRPLRALPRTAGSHRVSWDLHYPPPKTDRFEYPIAAVAGGTTLEPKGPWVLPGTYSVRLTVDGATTTQQLVVVMDPRVKTPMEGLQQQFALSWKLYEAIGRVFARLPRADNTEEDRPADPERRLHGRLLQVYGDLQGVDVAPTTQLVRAVNDLLAQVK